jgi:probable rRNA maturation factor
MDPDSTDGLRHGAATDAVVVVCSNEQDEIEVDTARWERLAVAVLDEVGAASRAEGCHDELTLTFVDRDEIAELNRDHRDVDGPTDVLSFPLDADSPGDGELRLVGDIVVCPAVVDAQAPSHAGDADDEMALMVVHGVLHLFGRDHADDPTTTAMRDEERSLLERHHWHGPTPAGFRQEHVST